MDVVPPGPAQSPCQTHTAKQIWATSWQHATRSWTGNFISHSMQVSENLFPPTCGNQPAPRDKEICINVVFRGPRKPRSWTHKASKGWEETLQHGEPRGRRIDWTSHRNAVFILNARSGRTGIYIFPHCHGSKTINGSIFDANITARGAKHIRAMKRSLDETQHFHKCMEGIQAINNADRHDGLA